MISPRISQIISAITLIAMGLFAWKGKEALAFFGVPYGLGLGIGLLAMTYLIFWLYGHTDFESGKREQEKYHQELEEAHRKRLAEDD